MLCLTFQQPEALDRGKGSGIVQPSAGRRDSRHLAGVPRDSSRFRPAIDGCLHERCTTLVSLRQPRGPLGRQSRRRGTGAPRRAAASTRDRERRAPHRGRRHAPDEGGSGPGRQAGRAGEPSPAPASRPRPARPRALQDYARPSLSRPRRSPTGPSPRDARCTGARARARTPACERSRRTPPPARRAWPRAPLASRRSRKSRPSDPGRADSALRRKR